MPVKRSRTIPDPPEPVAGGKQAARRRAPRFRASARHSGGSQTPPKPTEAQEQAAVVDWWRRYAPTQGLDPRLLMAIPNGAHLAGDGRQRTMQVAKLKRMGLVNGVPDLFLAVPRIDRDGLWLEMKRRGAFATPQQAELQQLLRNYGYDAATCDSAAVAINLIVAYLA